MKHVYLHRNPANRRLILIFTGWSTGPSLFRDPGIEGWDILLCHSYDNFDFPAETLQGYSTVYLFAWSLGVAAAEKALPPASVTAAYAINGTGLPVDDLYGIPAAIFNGTADNLTPRNLQKFQRRMCASGEEYRSLQPAFLTDSEDCDSLVAQLRLFASSSFSQCALPWRKVYISENDAIFPPENMRRFWQNEASFIHRPDIVSLTGGHYADLMDLIERHIADTVKVGRSFSASHHRYVSNATAQSLIADRLASMIPEQGDRRIKALEIGPGSGLFTRRLRERLNLSTLHLVDLYNISPEGYRQDEIFIQTDAEQWIEETPETWDMVLSASTVQWFANPRRFFENVYSRLRPGGHFICSSFVAGNLEELDRFRPSPLLYLTEEEISSMLADIFDEYSVRTESITLTFESARKALMHLRDTGVAGIGGSRSSLSRLLSALTPCDGSPVSLTYRPVYIHARKKDSGEQG